MKKWMAMLLTMILFVTAIPFAHAATTNFKDVPRNHWAYEAITSMAQEGIISGYNDGTFRPDNRITRAEFAKIMIAASGIDLGSAKNVSQTFEDVGRDNWAFLYVERAKNYLTGYKSGKRYYYKPNENAVREDIAVALVRLMGYDQSKSTNTSSIDRFKDKSDISKELRPYIAIAVDTDLIKGFNDNTFRPQAAITRAEAATLLYRAKEKLDETKIVFPAEPTQPKPEEPKTIAISDPFNDEKLQKWDASHGTGSWIVNSEKVTAFSANDKLFHYLLPLKWSEAKTSSYELQVSLTQDGRGLGGLYFNGTDKQATVVFLDKDALYVKRLTDVTKKDMTSIAKVPLKQQKSATLKIKVSGNDYSVYVNDTFVYSQEGQNLSGTKLGLYLNRDANADFPEKLTIFDNFSFKATLK